jgi:hypothetical protein
VCGELERFVVEDEGNQSSKNICMGRVASAGDRRAWLIDYGTIGC